MFDVILAGPYNAAVVLAALVAATLSWREMARRGWPPDVRAAVLAAVMVAAVIGSRWLPLEARIPEAGEKTILGALAGGAVALCLAAWWFRLGAAVFDAAVPAVPFAMAIGRVGCFLAGCCFGTPTSLPWGVRYPAGSLAFGAYTDRGLVAAGATRTMLIHPVQLYEACADVLLALLVVRNRNRFRSPGATALAFGAMYAVARFAFEFTRFEGTAIGGLKPVQWGLAAVALALGGALVMRERAAARFSGHASPVAASRRAGVRTAPKVAPFDVGLVIVAAASLLWASPLERFVLAGAVVVSLLVLSRHGAGARAGAPAGAFSMLMLLQSATASPKDDPYPTTYTVIGASGLLGKYASTYEESCSPVSVVSHHRASAAAVIAGVRRASSPGTGIGFTGTATFVSDAATFVQKEGGSVQGQWDETTKLSAVGGAFTGDGTHAGITLGGVVGAPPLWTPTVEGVQRQRFLPIVGLRFGRLTGTHVELRFLDPENVTLPGGYVQAGVAFGFGRNGSVARLGMSDMGPYLGMKGVTASGWEIEPHLAAMSDRYLFRLGVRHRFAWK